MADQEEEDLRAALRMSMQQHSPPEPKRSKPRDSPVGPPTSSSEESPEVKSRRLQRELMAAAAEKRMLASKSYSEAVGSSSKSVKKGKDSSVKDENLGKELLETEANQLFSMVFGDEVSKEILAQWSNQGIRCAKSLY